MEKKQIDQYNMLLTVENHFEDNEPIWSSNVLITDAKTALSDTIEQIATQAAQQMKTSKGATMNKAAVRSDLEAKGLYLSKALSAYCSLHPGLIQGLEVLKITKTEFSNFTGAKLLLAIRNLNEGAMTLIESLEPYGITQATLSALMDVSDDFYKIMREPVEVTEKHSKATDTIPVLLHQAIAILDVTMDNLIEVLRGPHPEFVGVYFLDRKIHHIGVRTMSLEITTLNANDNTPLVDAHLEIVGKGIKRISSKSGLNRVQNLPEGNYTLSVSRLGFVSQMIPFIILSGQTTQLVIEMHEVGAKAERNKVEEEFGE